jgi:hypothetical protein
MPRVVPNVLTTDIAAVAGLAFAVGPLGVVDAARDHHHRALGDVLSDALADAIETGDAVPLGLGLAVGRRFVNEADGYHDFVSALQAATPKGDAARAWLVCDHRFLRQWGLGIVKPAPVPCGHLLRAGYLKRSESLAELARICGIGEALEGVVAAFNRAASRGEVP